MTAGALLSYSVVAGISLAIFYAACKRATAGNPRPATSRAVLLFSYLAAFILIPLWLAVPSATPSGPALTQVTVGLTAPVTTADVAADVPGQSLPLTICLWTYLAGVALTLLYTAGSQLSLILLGRNARVERHDGYRLAVVGSRPDLPAFCRWRTIFMGSRAEADDSASIILSHERAHIALCHRYDLLIAQAAVVLCWYNPAAWLMRRELREVHEFQADRRVLDSGTDARAYQMLLIKTAVGPRFQSLTNSLNHSKLKKRITMMNSPKRSGRRLAALLLVPAALTAAAVLDSRYMESILEAGSAATLAQPGTGREINEIAADMQLPAPLSTDADEPAVIPAPATAEKEERTAPEAPQTVQAPAAASVTQPAPPADTTASPEQHTIYCYIDKREMSATSDRPAMIIGSLTLDNIDATNVTFTIENMPNISITGAKLVNGDKTYESNSISVQTRDGVSEVKFSFKKKLTKFSDDCFVSLNINGDDVEIPLFGSEKR